MCGKVNLSDMKVLTAKSGKCRRDTENTQKKLEDDEGVMRQKP